MDHGEDANSSNAAPAWTTSAWARLASVASTLDRRLPPPTTKDTCSAESASPPIGLRLHHLGQIAIEQDIPSGVGSAVELFFAAKINSRGLHQLQYVGQ
jgi:hypothetical protein